MNARTAQSAFSLVELSIVLVILGLLVGGILGGQALIRAAELRSVSTEYQRWTTATQTFRDKYFALPGDMTNATAFWGSVDPIPSNCRTSTGSGTLTCDGDGNGQIGSFNAVSNPIQWEVFRSWQHLSNAGLINGNYSGIFSPAVSPGVNIPASKLARAGWNLSYWGDISSAYSTIVYAGSYGHVMILGRPGWYHGMSFGGILTPAEAWNIDVKIDDGLPAGGFLLTPATGAGANPGCASSDSASAAIYDLSGTTATCGLIFKIRV